MEHFRVSRQVANSIAERFEMTDYFKPQSGCYGKLSPLQQTQFFLWFAGHQTASFRDVADRFNITISSLYRIIRRFIYFLSNCSPQVIKWPTQIEKNQIEEHFRQNGFPGVIGTIDGSHLKIDKPSDDPESYMNRKGYYSIQVSTTVSTCLFSVSVLIWSLPTLFIFLQMKIEIPTENQKRIANIRSVIDCVRSTSVVCCSIGKSRTSCKFVKFGARASVKLETCQKLIWKIVYEHTYYKLSQNV
jgi:hypothetical protein